MALTYVRVCMRVCMHVFSDIEVLVILVMDVCFFLYLYTCTCAYGKKEVLDRACGLYIHTCVCMCGTLHVRIDVYIHVCLAHSMHRQYFVFFGV